MPSTSATSGLIWEMRMSINLRMQLSAAPTLLKRSDTVFLDSATPGYISDRKLYM